LLLHQRQHEVAPLPGLAGITPGIVVPGALGQGGEQRGLGEVELPRVDAEVVPGRRLDASRAVAEVDVVQVQLEDLVLFELALDLEGHAHLEELAGQRPFLARYPLGEDVPRELHGDGAATLLHLA
jgi:hypothetical protein